MVSPFSAPVNDVPSVVVDSPARRQVCGRRRICHPLRRPAVRETARASLAFRKRTQPLASSSAGCILQNPDLARDRLPAGIPPSAGALIDRAGLKGHAIGGTSVSTVHANFIVNDGTATA